MSSSPLRALLAQTSFVRFWVSRVGGIMANQMLMVALGWHMYDLTASAWDLGLVGLFQFVPALVMTLPAGHVADRHHRARIFALCMLTQAAVAGVEIVHEILYGIRKQIFITLRNKSSKIFQTNRLIVQ